jgi:hypothetical protein
MNAGDVPISDTDWQHAEALEAILLHESTTADGDMDALLRTARRVTGLTQALGPPSPGLLRRIERLEQEPARPRWGWFNWRPWPAFAAMAAVTLLVVLTALGPGRGALASLYARLNLGNVDVSVTPDSLPVGPRHTTAYRESLPSLAEAQARVDFVVSVPEAMPAGYALDAVAAITYEGMPVWFPAPFYVELDYRGPAGQALLHDLTIRQFGMALGDQANIRDLRFAADQVAESHAVEMDGHPALMVVHRAPAEQPIRELVWQEGDVMLELLSQTLTPEEMMHIAASMH